MKLCDRQLRALSNMRGELFVKEILKKGKQCSGGVEVGEDVFRELSVKFPRPVPAGSKEEPAPTISQKQRNVKGTPWKRVRESWSKAEAFIRAANSRGLVATAAAATGLTTEAGQRVDEATFNQRVSSCFGGPQQKPCVHLRANKLRHYCWACGCPKYELAYMDGPKGERSYTGRYVKLHFPILYCPINKPGFTSVET